MAKSLIDSRVVHICLILLSVLATTYALMVMKPILIPFAFSLFLYFLISPAIDWLEARFRIPKGLSLLIAFSLLMVLFTFLFITLGMSINGFVKSSDIYQAKLIRLFDDTTLLLSEYDIKLDLSFIRRAITELPILEWVKSVSGSIVGIVTNFFLVFIFTAFLIVGKKTETEGHFISEEVGHRIARYVTTKFFTSALTGILAGIVLSIFNVQLALMFAVLTFFLNFIPNIGSIIAVLIPLPILILQFGFGPMLLIISGLLAVLQFSIGNILDPKLMGENLGLHPVVILLALLFWGFIWGVPGMFMSVPITAVMKLLLSKNAYSQPLANLLEGKFRR